MHAGKNMGLMTSQKKPTAERGERRGGLPAQSAEQGVAAHREVPGVAETHPSRPAERHAEGDKALGEPQGAPCPGSRDGGQPFGEMRR